MTTYKEIFGKPIKVVSSDPANEAEGQIWYNSTLGSFRSVVASGGTQAAAWLVGASAVSPGPANTEAYNWNGTSWTASGNYGTSSVVNMFGGGTQTAGWMCGGDADPGLKTFTNHYDGSSWSTAPALGTARSIGGQSGTQSSGLIFGGYTGSNTTATEKFTSETTSLNYKNISSS